LEGKWGVRAHQTQEMKGKEGSGDPEGREAKSGLASSGPGLDTSGEKGFFADVKIAPFAPCSRQPIEKVKHLPFWLDNLFCFSQAFNYPVNLIKILSHRPMSFEHTVKERAAEVIQLKTQSSPIPFSKLIPKQLRILVICI